MSVQGVTYLLELQRVTLLLSCQPRLLLGTVFRRSSDYSMNQPCIRFESRQEQCSLRHVRYGCELMIHGVFKHNVIDDLLHGNPEFLCLLGNLLVQW